MFNIKIKLGSLVLGVALASGLAITSLAPQAAMAQADLGSISGAVTDSTGAAIAKATITITNTDTGAARTAVTNNRGEFTVTQLNPGNYSVLVSASGFSDQTETLHVAVGSTSSLQLKLGVAGTKTEVLVASDASTTVQLDKPEITTTISQSDIAALPLPDRNPYALVSMSGNMSTDLTGGNRGVGFNIGGARSASVDILMDGAENTDLFGVGVGQSVPEDALAEFSVVIAGQGAEYGRASGGAVNVSTKSGSNSFHGDAYDYNRISTFASAGFNNNALFAAGVIPNAKSRYVRNQFGYFLGGPIKKDKLFFSSATEWTRVRSAQTLVAEVALPGLISMSADNMQSYFSTYGAALSHPVTGKTYTGQDLLDENKFTSDIPKIAVNHPEILTTPLFGTVAFQNPGDSGGGTPQNTWNTFNRVDWTISPKTSVYFRYTQLNSLDFAGTVNASPYAGYATGQTQKNYNGLISLTHSFTNNLVSNTKLLGTRFNNSQPLGAQPVSPTLYINSGGAFTIGSGTVYFPGYNATTPGSAIPFGGPQNFIQVGEDLEWIKGKHSIKAGGEFLFIKDNRIFGAYENAIDALVQTASKGALVNFIDGNLGYLSVALNPNGVYPCIRDAGGNYQVTPDCEISLPATSPNFSRSNRFQDGAGYVSDSFKATTRLTVNAGVRWEIYGPQHSQRAGLDANFFPANSGNLFDDIRNGQVLTRDKAPNGRMWNLNLLQFGPRAGFAYDIFGNGKDSIRGGFALSYERNFNNVTFNVIQNPPNYAVVALTSGTAINNNNLNVFGTGTGMVALPNTTLRAVDPKIKPSYAENWNLTLEHQLDPSTLVTIGYIGSRGVHNYSIANLNRQFTGGNYLGDANFSNRTNLQYSNINWRGADGDSYYESVNFGVRTNNLHQTGLSATANYTIGHSIDNTSSTFSDSSNTAGGGLVLGYLDPYNHALDRGDSDFDVRHRLTASVAWDEPFFKHSNTLEKTVLADWNLGTTFTASTGNPYTIFDCGLAWTVCPRASFVGKAPKKNGNLKDISGLYGPNTYSYQDLPDYLNADGSDFSGLYNEQVNPYSGTSDMPILGTNALTGGFVTNMDRRNSYMGPGAWGEDFKLSKDIKIHERFGLKLSGTFINVFNHANTYLNLGGSNDVSSYNATLAYKGGNRNTELEAKFTF